MKTTDRLDPALLSTDDRRLIEELSVLVAQERHPNLVARDGSSVALPQAVVHVLSRVVSAMRQGQAIVVIPDNECFTTQAAANYLGISRPFLVKLLEQGKIDFHKTGSHRRIYLKDLMEYQKRRQAERKKNLDDLTAKLIEGGVYDKVPQSDEG